MWGEASTDSDQADTCLEKASLFSLPCYKERQILTLQFEKTGYKWGYKREILSTESAAVTSVCLTVVWDYRHWSLCSMTDILPSL